MNETDMRQDKMTNKERIEALLGGKPVDRVPLYPFIMGFSARNVGYHIATICSSDMVSHIPGAEAHDKGIKGHAVHRFSPKQRLYPLFICHLVLSHICLIHVESVSRNHITSKSNSAA